MVKKKLGKKILTAGIAGVTALSQVPVNVFATEVRNSIGSEIAKANKVVSMNDMIIRVFNDEIQSVLTLESGQFQYDSKNNKLYFSHDAKMHIDASTTGDNDGQVDGGNEDLGRVIENGVTNIILKDGESVQEIGTDQGSFALNGVSADATLEFTRQDGSLESHALSQYFENGYGMNVSFYVSNKEAVVSDKLTMDTKDVKVSTNQVTKVDWYGQGTMHFAIDLDRDMNVPLDVYGVEVTANGKAVQDMVEENGQLKFDVDSETFYKTYEGEMEVKVVLGTQLGEPKTVTQIVHVDTIAPRIVFAPREVVKGLDGRNYMKVYQDETGKKTASFEYTVEDQGLYKNGNCQLFAQGAKNPGVDGYGLIVDKALTEGKYSGSVMLSVDDIRGLDKNSSFAKVEGYGKDEVSLQEAFGEFSFDNVEFVEEFPSTAVEMTKDDTIQEVNGYYTGNGDFHYHLFNEKCGIQKVIVKVNGEVATQEEWADAKTEVTSQLSIETINTLKKDNQVAHLEVYTYDVNDQEQLAYKEDMNIDITAPTIEDKTTSLTKDNIHIYDGVLYVPQKFEMNGNVVENDSGIQSLDILKDGQVVSNAFPYTITESGEYSVKVTDKVGLVTVYPLSDFVGEAFDSLVISDDVPLITNINVGHYIDDNQVQWTSTSQPTLSLMFEGEHLSTYKVKLNGHVVFDEKVTENNFYKQLGELEEGKKYTVEIELSNKMGIVVSDTMEFQIDKTAPVIDGMDVASDYRATKTGMYFSEKPQISIRSHDEGIGKTTYYLYKDEQQIAYNDTGIFTIEANGSYQVKVNDAVGNQKTVSLNELLKTESNRVVIDEEAPEIAYQLPDGGIGEDNNRFGQHFDMDVSIHDNEALKSINVKINDIVVAQNYDDEVVKDYVYHLKTADIPASNDSKYIVTITVEDQAGHQSEKILTYYVDTKAPIIENVKSSSEGIIKDNVMLGKRSLFGEKPTLTFEVSEQTGVSKYILRNKDKQTEAENTNGVFTLSEDGLYTIEVIDVLGHSTGEVELKRFGIEKVVIDEEAPDVRLDMNMNDEVVEKSAHDGLMAYSGDVKGTIGVSDDLCNIKVYVDGVEAHSFEDSFTFGMHKIVNGVEGETQKHTIKVEAVDLFGRETVKEVSFYIDKKGPAFTEKSFNEAYNDSVKGIFFKEKPTLTVKAEDETVAIDRYELVCDGQVVSQNQSGIFELSNGEYTVRAYDVLGNVKEVTVQDLLGLKSNTIVIDGTLPKITIERAEGLNNWFAKDFTYEIKASDETLESARLIVNGQEVQKIEDIHENTITLSFDTADVKANGYRYDVVIEAVDGSGNKMVQTDVFYVDMLGPDQLQAKIDNSYKDRGYGVYFTEEPVVQFAADDNDGVDGLIYELLDEHGNPLESNDTGIFVLKDGKYGVRVVDALGNVSEVKTVAELMGWKSNHIVIDTEKTKAFLDLLPGDVENWYKDHVRGMVTFLDGQGLYRAELWINGEMIDEFEATQQNQDDALFEFNTKDMKANGYQYDIEVRYEDNAGRSDRFEKTIYVDQDAPQLTAKSLDEDRIERDYGVYFKHKPTLRLAAEDQGVGDVTYIVRDGNQKVVENTSGEFVLGTGEYWISVKDALGNETEPVNLKDLMGLSHTKIVVDGIAPEIAFTRNEGDINGWYNEDVSYSVDYKDETGIAEAEILINGESVAKFTAEDDIARERHLDAMTSFGKPEGLYTYNVELKVTDNAGNVKVVKDQVFVDKDCPVIDKATISEDKEEFGYGVFYKDKPTLKIEASDAGIGVKHIKLVDAKGQDIEKNQEGTFVLDSGTYSVIVEDELGNETKAYTLQDLLGLSSNDIVVDGQAPVVTSKRPDGDVNGWYADDVTYAVQVKDNIGLRKVTVAINGKVVDSFDADKGEVLQKEFIADTSQVKAKADGSYDVVVEARDNAGNVAKQWTDTIYIDRTAPVIDQFVINDADYKEGAESNGSDRYGFYLDTATDVTVHVSDGQVSSGMKEIHYVLKDDKGTVVKSGIAPIQNGTAVVHLDKNFKGFIEAYAVDQVKNAGKTNKPDGIVSEDSNVHVNTSKIEFTLPKTQYKDHQGYNLYSGSVNASVVLTDTTSGLKRVEWGINGDSKGVIDIDKNGHLSGDTGVVKGTNKNLVVNLEKALNVPNNANGLKVWVKVTDRAGHISEGYQMLSIDKDVPVIEVTYDEHEKSHYYDRNRTATVRVTERNFRAADVKFSGDYGKVGSWKHVRGNVWECKIVFDRDADYEWAVNYTDMAGNKAKEYKSERFTIDKTRPELNVTFDNNRAENDYYYKAGRTATVTIKEHNFDASRVRLTGDGRIGGWTHRGDTHTAHIVFNGDGEYEFALELSDKAGNTSRVYESGKFVIDLKNPEIEFRGVQENKAYGGEITPSIRINDINVDSARSTFVMKKDGKTIGGGKNAVDGQGMTVSFANMPQKPENDGIYTITANVFDKAGNTFKKDITYSVNRFGSTYTSDMLNTINGKYLSDVKDIVFSEINVNPLKKYRVQLVKNGGNLEVLKEGKDYTVKQSRVKGGWYQYIYIIDRSLFEEDGHYEIQVSSTDALGHVSQSQDEYRNYDISFTIDKTKPIVQMLNIEDKGIYDATEKVVKMSVTDNLKLSKVHVYLNGKEINIAQNGDEISFTMKESTSLQDMKVEAVDEAGNVMTVELNDILVSTNAFYRWMANKPLFYGTIIGTLGLAGLIVFFVKRKKDDKTTEEN